MSKKLTWGSWIVISFILFGVGTFAMIYISMNTKVDLVTDDYYEKELQYQEHIDVIASTGALEEKVMIELMKSAINIKYPPIGESHKYSGTILFFRPSDKGKDFTTEVKPDSAYSQQISTETLDPGIWRVKISWNAGGENYYYEQTVFIQ